MNIKKRTIKLICLVSAAFLITGLFADAAVYAAEKTGNSGQLFVNTNGSAKDARTEKGKSFGNTRKRNNSGKEDNSDLVWHFIKTESIVSDPINGREYSDSYELNGEWYYHLASYKKGRKHEDAVFDLRWDAPPAVIKQGEKVVMKMQLNASGETKQMFSECISLGSGTFIDKDSFFVDYDFEDEDQHYCFFVGTSLDAPYPNYLSCKVSGYMPNGARKGDQAAISVTTNGATQFYIYELTKYKDSMKKETVGLQLPEEEYYDYDIEEEFICDWSDTKLIDMNSWNDLVRYFNDTKQALPAGKTLAQMAINEIYARHGYKFTTKAIQDFFENKSWYRPKTNDMNAIAKELNSIEQKNVTFLKGLK